MPDTTGQSGIEHFEERVETLTETSNDGAFSTKDSVPGSGNSSVEAEKDGHLTVETRGAPEA